MEKEKLLIIFPCAGPMDPRCAVSLNLASVQVQAEGKLDISGTLFTDRVLIDSARNHMAEAAQTMDADWYFWADSDMVFHPRTISMLYETAKKHSAKMVSGIYYKRLAPFTPVVFRKEVCLSDSKEKLTPMKEKAMLPVMPAQGSTEPFEVDAVGFGCVLIHKSVFAEVAKPYFFFDYHKDGYMIGEDLNFCEKVRKCGIIILADPKVQPGHIGEAPIIDGRNVLKSDFIMSEITR